MEGGTITTGGGTGHGATLRPAARSPPLDQRLCPELRRLDAFELLSPDRAENKETDLL